jgi:hypothetical protein
MTGSAAEATGGASGMGQTPGDRRSVRSEAIAALLAAAAGSGIGWVIWLATGNIGVAIGIAGPMAALTNFALRRVIG